MLSCGNFFDNRPALKTLMTAMARVKSNCQKKFLVSFVENFGEGELSCILVGLENQRKKLPQRVCGKIIMKDGSYVRSKDGLDDRFVYSSRFHF